MIRIVARDAESARACALARGARVYTYVRSAEDVLDGDEVIFVKGWHIGRDPVNVLAIVTVSNGRGSGGVPGFLRPQNLRSKDPVEGGRVHRQEAGAAGGEPAGRQGVAEGRGATDKRPLASRWGAEGKALWERLRVRWFGWV